MNTTKVLAIAVGLNLINNAIITLTQEFCWFSGNARISQFIHDSFANEILPVHAMIQQIILLQNSSDGFPTVVTTLKAQVDYQTTIFP